MTIINSTTTDKKLIYKATTGAGAHQIKDYIGTEISIMHIILAETKREDGTDAIQTTLITTDGDAYQTLSPTIQKCVETIMDTFDMTQDEVSVRISTGKSKGERDFLTLEIL